MEDGNDCADGADSSGSYIPERGRVAEPDEDPGRVQDNDDNNYDVSEGSRISESRLVILERFGDTDNQDLVAEIRRLRNLLERK